MNPCAESQVVYFLSIGTGAGAEPKVLTVICEQGISRNAVTAGHGID